MNQKEYIVPVGEGIYEVNTGDWRTHRPCLNQDLCIKCGRCFLYCPVFAIHKVESLYQIELKYCKGCGICAYECPNAAITMMEEGGDND